MQPRSPINRSRKTSASRTLKDKRVLDLKGLNTTAPDHLLEDGESPSGKNFRLYADDDNDSRVAINTRKGHVNYITPVGETLDDSETSATGAADKTVTTTAWIAQKFTSGTAGRLTKVELSLKNNNSGVGPLMVAIYTDSSGSPGTQLALSSISGSSISSSYAYLEARFINAPLLDGSSSYWIVAYQQDNGSGDYKWESTTNSTDAKTSTSGATWSGAAYSVLFKQYYATDGGVKGAWRRATQGTKETLFAHGTDIYKVDESDGSTTSIESSLSSGATYYHFTEFEGNTYAANGVDPLKKYDGSAVEDINTPAKPRYVLEHKNRMFIAAASNETYMYFSELADFETWKSTSFFTVPSPKTGDPITGVYKYQDNLIIGTRANKYILYGNDPASFSLVQAGSQQGVAHQRSMVADLNFLYYASHDGIYRFDGNADTRISDKIETLFKQIADPSKITAIYHDRKVRFYAPKSGSGANNIVLIWDTVHEQWYQDTGVWGTYPIVNVKEGGKRLMVMSSLYGGGFDADIGGSDLGQPIDFEYRTKYFNFNSEINEKSIRRFYPLVRLQPVSYNLTVEFDKNFADSPASSSTLAMQGTGDVWGGGDLWGSTFAYGETNFNTNHRVTPNIDGFWVQARFSRNGVDNPVELIGYIWFYKIKGIR